MRHWSSLQHGMKQINASGQRAQMCACCSSQKRKQALQHTCLGQCLPAKRTAAIAAGMTSNPQAAGPRHPNRGGCAAAPHRRTRTYARATKDPATGWQQACKQIVLHHTPSLAHPHPQAASWQEARTDEYSKSSRPFALMLEACLERVCTQGATRQTATLLHMRAGPTASCHTAILIPQHRTCWHLPWTAAQLCRHADPLGKQPHAGTHVATHAHTNTSPVVCAGAVCGWAKSIRCLLWHCCVHVQHDPTPPWNAQTATTCPSLRNNPALSMEPAIM